MKKVSVIIPNYNHADYLTKRIDSVLDQTYVNIEVIILDDSSTDNSKEIISSYKNNPKITHIVQNTINSGSPFIQWQKGFELATGEYIWIAESDDYAEFTFLEKLIPAFEKSHNVGMVYCDSNVVDSKGIIHPDYYKKFKNSNFKTEKWSYDHIRPGIEEIKENLFFECTVNNTSAMIFKKSLLKYVEFEKLKTFKYCGDWYFFISLLIHCDIVYNREALSYFKYGTDNFKKGTRSVINYFKERFLVRYYYWNIIKPHLAEQDKNKFYKQITSEMRMQINEMVKGKSSINGTIKAFLLLRQINSMLFRKHFLNTLKSYVWKN